MLVAKKFDARRRLDFAEVNGLADFEMADIDRDDFRQILGQARAP